MGLLAQKECLLTQRGLISLNRDGKRGWIRLILEITDFVSKLRVRPKLWYGGFKKTAKGVWGRGAKRHLLST